MCVPLNAFLGNCCSSCCSSVFFYSYVFIDFYIFFLFVSLLIFDVNHCLLGEETNRAPQPIIACVVVGLLEKALNSF